MLYVQRRTIHNLLYISSVKSFIAVTLGAWSDKSVQQKSDCEHKNFYCIKYYWPEAVLFPRRNHEAWERKERGRDNRHGRHIKTRQGDAARQSSAAQTDRRIGAEYAVGLHSRAAWSSTFYFTTVYKIFSIKDYGKISIYFPYMIKSSYHWGFLNTLV